MPDYKRYRVFVGISNPEMTRAVQEKYTAYNKIASSFVNHPSSFGVCLLPDAEAHLVEKFGPGPGLAHEPPPPKPKPKRNHDNAAKPCRICFRTTPELYDKIPDLQDAWCAGTMQELFERLLEEAVRRWEEDES